MLLEESTTYQGIIEDGIAKGMAKGLSQGLRSTIVRIGTKRFGPPAESTTRLLQSIGDAGRLELLADRILDAEGWDDLLAAE